MISLVRAIVQWRRRRTPVVDIAFEVVDHLSPVLREMGAELRRLDEYRRRLLVAEAAHRRDA